MTPLGLSAKALALDLNYPFEFIVALLDRRRGMDIELAGKLGTKFDMTSDYWMQMQHGYDQAMARNRTQVMDWTPLAVGGR